jgi:hypothetical protein
MAGGGMARQASWVLSAVLAAAMLGPPALSQPATDSPPTAKDWSALGALPDWSGVWIPDQADQNAQMRTNPPPWTPIVAAQVAKQGEEEKAGRPLGVFTNCLPEAMPSWMLVSHNAMEILFTPGRVTLLGESDSNRLRRIHTDGRPHPEDPDLTFHGHSIGKWEGDTLVVDTVGVMPETWIAISEAQGIPNNGDLHVVERIRLASPDILEDELTITAPKVLTEPWVTKRLFKRLRGAKNDPVEGVCLEGSFSRAKDSQGNSVFVPQARTEDGNRMPLQ